ncbi:hypothetical protein Cme02nite_70300 [Catellatospora methionotrophica]|uniref:Uncharacterized protein n=1 Tax=Catellatospora methionotrophica TaxID=121620 RepID=A0A8J3LD09_9ACTN|nr:hypothetical protein Cme02nite_70300 [Catellatospora methionotrophica]
MSVGQMRQCPREHDDRLARDRQLSAWFIADLHSYVRRALWMISKVGTDPIQRASGELHHVRAWRFRAHGTDTHRSTSSAIRNNHTIRNNRNLVGAR